MKYINEEGNDVPENNIVFYPKDKVLAKQMGWDINDVIEPLAGKKTRDFFLDWAYYCLPLTIANQYGFVVKAAIDFSLFWPGGDAPVYVDTKNKQVVNQITDSVQEYFTNFKMGILSIENSFILRTPPKTNLMIMPVPNHFIQGVHVMSGVVEADNLRRSFTFNLKVTNPGVKIHIKKGDWLAAFMPIPRYYVDAFSMTNFKDVFDEETYSLEKASMDKLSYERQVGDKEMYENKRIELSGMGRRYFKGLFPNDKPFRDHQRKIDKKDSTAEEDEDL